MGEREDLHQAIVMLSFQELREVARQGSLYHRVRLERGLRGDAALQLVEDEGELTNQGILRPERAVVVEDRDPVRHRHEVRTAFRRDALDELENGLPGLALVPRWKGVGGFVFRCHLTLALPKLFRRGTEVAELYTATSAGLNVKASNEAAFSCFTKASDATPAVTWGR